MRVLSTPFFAKFDFPAPCALEASIIFSVTKTSAEVSRRQNLHCRGSNDTAMTDCFPEAYTECRYFTHTHTHTHTRTHARTHTHVLEHTTFFFFNKKRGCGRLSEFWREREREKERERERKRERERENFNT